LTTPHALLRTACSPTVLTALISSFAIALPAAAQTARPINIQAGPLDAGLLALAAQSHEQVLYSPAMVAGRRNAAVQGNLTVEQALARMAPGVVVSRLGPGVVTLKVVGLAAPIPTAASSRSEAARGGPFATDPSGSGQPDARAAEEPPALPATTTVPGTVSEVEVVGSHIRGVTTASPVRVLDAEALQATGHTTLAGALASLPQNFGGTDSEATASTNADRTSTNNTYASGLNLRGLGSNATLVLINGRRMAGAGAKGDFADLSTIPAVAVERVEVLLDGASALYGSDAVGGVVNVVLRQRFDGAETRLVGGAGAGGHPDELQFGQTFGRSWQSGSALIAFEYDRRGDLPASARDFTASADLRPLGGTDHRTSNAFPGNILALNPTTGTTGPAFAIPAGQNGVGLKPANLLAGVVNLSNPHAGIDILPDQTRDSLYAVVRQELGARVNLLADARYGFRHFGLDTGWPASVFTVTRANPFFVAPGTATSEQIAYSFASDLPQGRLEGSEESLSSSVGLDVRLPRGWQANSWAAFAQEIGEVHSRGLINTSALQEALGSVADRPQTAFSTAANGFFNPFAGTPGANSSAITSFIASGFSTARTKDQTLTASLQADGPLWDLPGGPVRAALGLQARRETFDRGGSNYLSGTAPTPISPTDAERTVTAAYAELNVPLVGEDNRLPGVQGLDLSLAGRVERYSDFGTTANPQLGLLWKVDADLRLRASYGRSFRAPALRELDDPELFGPSLLPVPGGTTVLSLLLNGGNPALRPETAVSWTAGLDYAPVAVPGLKLTADLFDITYRNRIDRPAMTSLGTALSDPTLSPFVTHITPATNPADRALIAALLASPALSTAQGSFPPESYGAIVDVRYVNTGELKVRGLDLTADDRLTLGSDSLNLAANAAWLFTYDQQVTPTSRVVNVVNTVGFPLRLRARASGDWRHGPFGLLAAVNYAGGYHDTLGASLRAQTTVDLQVRWTAPADSPTGPLAATLSVRNLFDRDPPLYNGPTGFGFDPTNGDPVGRFVSLQLVRRW